MAYAKTSQIIYRPEWNLHLGHLPTLYYNNQWAEQNQARCLLILDDIYRTGYLENFRRDFEWLKFSHIMVKPLSEYLPQIIEETIKLIRLGCVRVESHQRGVIQRYNAEISESIFKNIVEKSSTESYHVKFITPLGSGSQTQTHPQTQTHSQTHPVWGHASSKIFVENQKDSEQNQEQVSVIFRSFRGEKNWTIDYAVSMIDILEGVTHIVNLSKTDILNYEISQRLYKVLNLPLPEIVTHKPFRISDFRYQKIQLDEMIQKGLIHNWDDPRLLTLSGLRHRGYPVELLHKFCEMGYEMGMIGVNQLDYILQNHCSQTCQRRFAILDPVKVTITNWDPKVYSYVCKPRHPHFSQNGHYLVPLSREVYLDRYDLTEREVRLKYACLLTFTNNDTYHPEAVSSQTQQKDRPYVHWISVGFQPVRQASFYMYRGYYTGNHQCNLSNKMVQGLVEEGCEFVPGEIYQFERIGYFVCHQNDNVSGDSDSSISSLVFYQIVPYRNRV